MFIGGLYWGCIYKNTENMILQWQMHGLFKGIDRESIKMVFYKLTNGVKMGFIGELISEWIMWISLFKTTRTKISIKW